MSPPPRDRMVCSTNDINLSHVSPGTVPAQELGSTAPQWGNTSSSVVIAPGCSIGGGKYPDRAVGATALQSHWVAGRHAIHLHQMLARP